MDTCAGQHRVILSAQRRPSRFTQFAASTQDAFVRAALCQGMAHDARPPQSSSASARSWSKFAAVISERTVEDDRAPGTRQSHWPNAVHTKIVPVSQTGFIGIWTEQGETRQDMDSNKHLIDSWEALRASIRDKIGVAFAGKSCGGRKCSSLEHPLLRMGSPFGLSGLTS